MALLEIPPLRKKHGILKVIEYEGSPDVFIWKHDAENFNTKSQLIVHEGAEAILVKNGQALDTFVPGRYTLETQNIPLLRHIINIPTGGVTPFQCQVYFVNTAVSMGIEWGTDSPILMNDPEYGVRIEVTAYGDFSLRVVDGRKLLTNLLGGNMKRYSHDEIKRYFSGIMAAYVRECIARTMEENHLGAMRVNTMLTAISSDMQNRLKPVFAGYGMSLEHFVVADISHTGLEEIDREIRRGTVRRVISNTDNEIEHDKISLEAERIARTGAITEVQQAGFDVARKLAANRGADIHVGGYANSFSSSVQSPAVEATNIVNTMVNAVPRGATASAPANDLTMAQSRKARLQELKELFDEGLITEEAYTAKLAEVMEHL